MSKVNNPSYDTQPYYRPGTLPNPAAPAPTIASRSATGLQQRPDTPHKYTQPTILLDDKQCNVDDTDKYRPIRHYSCDESALASNTVDAGRNKITLTVIPGPNTAQYEHTRVSCAPSIVVPRSETPSNVPYQEPPSTMLAPPTSAAATTSYSHGLTVPGSSRPVVDSMYDPEWSSQLKTSVSSRAHRKPHVLSMNVGEWDDTSICSPAGDTSIISHQSADESYASIRLAEIHTATGYTTVTAADHAPSHHGYTVYNDRASTLLAPPPTTHVRSARVNQNSTHNTYARRQYLS
jgi:hypothetical protein